MLIAEELLLLCLDDDTGRRMMGKESLAPALGGALLVELALRERIGITPHEAGRQQRGRVQVISTTPTDHPELDAALGYLADREGIRVKDLLSEFSGKRITKGLLERLVGRLVQGGVLREERSAVLGIRSWPTVDPRPEEEVRGRLQSALVGGQTPAERTVALIALLAATNRLTKVVTTGDRGALRARAKELSEGDWAAAAVKKAIDEVNATMTAVTVAAVSGGNGGGG